MIDGAVQRGDIAFFRRRARTEHIVCTPQNTPPRGPGGPACERVGQEFDGFGLAGWRSECGLQPVDTALHLIERLRTEAVPGGRDKYGGSEPNVYALGVQNALLQEGPAQVAVVTAIIQRPPGPLRVALVTHWWMADGQWRFVFLLSAFVLGEEFLKPADVARGWMHVWERFQP